GPIDNYSNTRWNGYTAVTRSSEPRFSSCLSLFPKSLLGGRPLFATLFAKTTSRTPRVARSWEYDLLTIEEKKYNRIKPNYKKTQRSSSEKQTDFNTKK
ncbi:hypothetical protein L9F63_012898, partial [Diploptera punctata]